jgi:hypothetical protein
MSRVHVAARSIGMWFIACVVWMPWSVLAQSTSQSGTLLGEVHDSSGGVLTAASITVSSPNLIGGSATTHPDARGAYRLPALPPGTYELIVSSTGFDTVRKTGLALLPGITTTVDFELMPGGAAERVEVVAATATIDVRNARSSTIIPRAILEELPVSRSVSSYVNLVPGVVKDIAFGSAMRSNPFTLDGASGNDPSVGTPKTTPSSSWIDELQVITVGANAEFGEYTGAPLNAITRSGSDHLSGLVEYWTTAPSWVADNRENLPPDQQSRFRPLDILARHTAIGQLGGPLRRDRLWFFGGADFYHNEQLPSGFAAIAERPESAVSNTNEPKWLVKLSAAPHRKVRLSGYVGRDVASTDNWNASPLVRPEALQKASSHENLWNVQTLWTVSERTLVEARSGGNTSSLLSGPKEWSAIEGPPPHFDVATHVNSVNVEGYEDVVTRQISTTASLSHYFTRAEGRSHEMKIGVEHERSSMRRFDGAPGGLLFLDMNGAPYDVLTIDVSGWRPSHTRTTLFAQDQWTASPGFTINGGIRAGFFRGAITGFPTQFSASAIAPRVGFTWDVYPTHVMAVRGHFGRYHEAMATSFYDFLDPLSGAATADSSVDPNIKFPYADEWLAAMDRSVAGQVTLTAQYIHRGFGSFVGMVAPMDRWAAEQRIDPGPDGKVGTSDDGGLFTVYVLNPGGTTPVTMTNPPGAYKHFDGFQLIATRHGSGIWQGQASYTYSRTRASFDTGPESNAGSNDLGFNGVYMNPNRPRYSGGRPTNDFKNELKAVGTVKSPRWGLIGGVVYRYQTGVTWGRTVWFPGATLLSFIRVEPRTRSTPNTNVLDLRVEKAFLTGRSKLNVYADIFNATNQGVATRYRADSGQDFGLPSGWSDPRTLRAGVRLNF